MEAHVALLTWNRACTVGVRAMDDQHGILMDTLNELRLAAVRGSGREQVSEVLDRLIEFTRMHFWSEEQLLEQYGFPSLAEHRRSTSACWRRFSSPRIACSTATRCRCARCSAFCARPMPSTSRAWTASTGPG